MFAKTISNQEQAVLLSYMLSLSVRVLTSHSYSLQNALLSTACAYILPAATSKISYKIMFHWRI